MRKGKPRITKRILNFRLNYVMVSKAFYSFNRYIKKNMKDKGNYIIIYIGFDLKIIFFNSCWS